MQRFILSPLLLACVLVPLAGAAIAQSGNPDEQATADTGTVQPPLTEAERKQRAKEARIEEYLRKKEANRARKEQLRPPAAGRPAASQAPIADSSRRRGPGLRLPRNLAQAQDSVRDSTLGRDPTVQTYLELIDRQAASPQQLAAFGNFVAENGLMREATAYYEVALHLAPKDSLLWTNFGTLHRQQGDRQGALSAYHRALAIDANNPMAHYNLAAVFDEQGKYDESIAAYTTALTLDPTLGDPAYNPQAANNERLLAVKLLLYRQQVGSLGLPLSDVPTDPVPDALDNGVPPGSRR